MATTLTTLFTNIANAIRLKTGGSAQIVAENFPAAIGAIPTGAQFLGLEQVTATATGITLPEKFANAKIIAVILGADNTNVTGATETFVGGVWYEGISNSQLNSINVTSAGKSSTSLMKYDKTNRTITSLGENASFATTLHLVFCWG